MTLSHSPNIVRDGLVLYLDAANSKSYPGTGTTWTDLSGNGNNGTLVNGVGYSSNNQGTLIFDGSNDYIPLQINNLGINVNSFTCECVFRYSTVGNTNTLFSINYHYPGTGYLIRQSASNAIQVFSDNGAESSVQSNTKIPPLTIYHLTVCQLNNQCTIYINGILDRQTYLSNPVLDTTEINYVGRRGLPFGAYLDGNIYVLKTYNRALTESEIKQNFNALRGRYGI